MITLTLMRHGRSRADDEGVFEGRYDLPLTDVGRKQVLDRALIWRHDGVSFDLIVASTLARAQESAQIVARTLNVPLELDPGWMEVDNGKLAGLTFEEGNRRFPRPTFRSPYEPMAVSGETEYCLHHRAAAAVERIIQRGHGSYLVTAHGGILNAAIRHILSIPVPVNRMGAWFAFGDAGCASFSYDPDCHRWVMRSLTGSN